jgi:hypothetical protein
MVDRSQVGPNLFRAALRVIPYHEGDAPSRRVRAARRYYLPRKRLATSTSSVSRRLLCLPEKPRLRPLPAAPRPEANYVLLRGSRRARSRTGLFFSSRLHGARSKVRRWAAPHHGSACWPQSSPSASGWAALGGHAGLNGPRAERRASPRPPCQPGRPAPGNLPPSAFPFGGRARLICISREKSCRHLIVKHLRIHGPITHHDWDTMSPNIILDPVYVNDQHIHCVK